MSIEDVAVALLANRRIVDPVARQQDWVAFLASVGAAFGAAYIDQVVQEALDLLFRQGEPGP